MPVTWNGRLESTGNSGYAGSMAIDGRAMVYAIDNGWAVAANDMGTAPSNIVDGEIVKLTSTPSEIGVIFTAELPAGHAQIRQVKKAAFLPSAGKHSD